MTLRRRTFSIALDVSTNSDCLVIGECQNAPAHAVDSDSSVSLSSLTDSSVDTASDSEKILLPEIKEGEESHLPVQPN